MGLNLFSREKTVDYVPEWNENRKNVVDPLVVKILYMNFNEVIVLQQKVKAEYREIDKKVKNAPKEKKEAVRQEEILAVNDRMLKENVLGFENLAVDGIPSNSVDDFMRYGIFELIEEISNAIVTFTMLTEGERKNLQGLSDTDSKQHEQEAPSSATTAHPESEKKEIVETEKDSAMTH